jgi:hypothetical protein
MPKCTPTNAIIRADPGAGLSIPLRRQYGILTFAFGEMSTRSSEGSGCWCGVQKDGLPSWSSLALSRYHPKVYLRWQIRLRDRATVRSLKAVTGQAVFHETCAVCHGENLQGGAGPALGEQQFLSVSQYQRITAEQFYHFMPTHMPLTQP